MIRRLISKWRLYRYKQKGLQLGDKCRFIGIPSLGSEPYLISIGSHVTISAGVRFINHDGGTWVFRSSDKYKNVIKYGRITIMDNCFIGTGAILMPGITIGPNAVVGSGALVTRNVPPNTVVAGIPAKALMSVEEYAEKCLRETPAFDSIAYRQDKRHELSRLFPRPW